MMTFEGYRHGEPGFRRVAIALFAGSFASFGLLYNIQPLLPGFSRDFEVSASTAALSISFATITLGIVMLFAGQLSEIVGRTPMMRWCTVAAALVTAVTALAPTWGVMLGLRAVVGVLLAGFPAVAMASFAKRCTRPRTLGRPGSTSAVRRSAAWSGGSSPAGSPRRRTGDGRWPAPRRTACCVPLSCW